MPLPTVIVGGGLAGMAAAVQFAEAGRPALLVEARASLGGRAGSFVDAVTGEIVDNCQHVTMGCCTALAAFCKTVGIDDLLRREPQLYFVDESGGISVVRNSILPAPLHQFPSFLRLRFLTLREKMRIAFAVARMKRQADLPKPTSIRDWLLAHRQSERTLDRYWGVVLVSALNETLDRIDYRYARQVFMEGFFASKHACTVSIPTVPLSEFYGPRIVDWLKSRNVAVRWNAAATRLEVEGDRVVGLTLRDGASLRTNQVILATSWQRVGDLLPQAWQTAPPFAALRQLEASPIIGIHLWFDRPVMDWPHLVVVGRTTQWLFRRPGIGNGECVQAVISAAGSLATLGRDAIQRRVLDEVHAIVPKSKSASLVHSRVIIEKSATYSIVPGVDALRPDNATPIRNLWLAGDYVKSGWPATMEGAVRSGNRAAQLALAAQR